MILETQRFLFALIFAMAAFSASADNVIRAWVDDKGHIHYGNIAPDLSPERTLEAPPVPAPEEQEAARERAAKDKERLSQWESSRRAEAGGSLTGTLACDRAVQIVEFLQHYHELGLMHPLSTGEVTLITEDERGAYLNTARRSVHEECRLSPEVGMYDLWVGLFWPRTARAANVLPTFFIPNPAAVVPNVEIKGGRSATPPSTPTTSVVNAIRPTAPLAPTTSIAGSKRPTSAGNPNAGSLR